MKKPQGALRRSSTYGKDLQEAEMGGARKVVHRAPHRSVGLIACSWIQPQPIEYESQLERRFVQRALLFPGVHRIVHQPFTLDLMVDDRQIRYTPDFLVAFRDSTRIVIEVKPHVYVQKHQEKLAAAQKFFASAGDDLIVVTDREIDVGEIPDNVALLQRYARSAVDNDTRLRCIETARMAYEPLPLGQLAKASNTTIEAVFCLIGRGVFTAPLDCAITADTKISLTQEENKNASIRFRRWINTSPWTADSGVPPPSFG